LNQKGRSVIPVFLILLVLVLYQLVNRAIWLFTAESSLPEVIEFILYGFAFAVLFVFLVRSFGTKSDKTFVVSRMDSIFGEKKV